MVDKSTEYKEAIDALTRESKIKCSLKLNDGTSEFLTDDDIVSGSIIYDNNCVDGSEFQLGCTYMGQLKISLYKKYDIDKLVGGYFYTFNYRLKYKESTYGTKYYKDIAIGYFIITEALEEDNCIKLTCYDKFYLGDSDRVYTKHCTNYTPKQLLTSFAVNYEIGSLYNGDYVTECSPVDSSGEIIKMSFDKYTYKTSREACSDLCQLLGGFLTQYRGTSSVYSTYSKFKRFGDDSVTLVNSHIKSLKVSNYTVSYDGVIMYAEGIPYTAGTVDEDSNIYSFETKLLKYNTAEERQAIVDNLWNNVLQNIEYTPVDLEYFGDPSMELGDEILIPYKDGYTKSFIMQDEWTYRGNQKIKAVGSNPAISKNVTSYTQKEYDQLKETVESLFNIRTLSNDSSFTQSSSTSYSFFTLIKDETINIAKQGNFILQGAIKMNVTNDSSAQFKIRVNGTANSFIQEYNLESGINTINFFDIINMQNLNDVNKLEIQIAYKSSSASTLTIESGDINLAIIGSLL